MKKNGFTLIELLAVIVILAIIALIATPIILGIINDAREKSNERSVELYASAVRNGIAAYQLREGKEVLPGTYNKKNKLPFEVEYDGKVDCESIIINADGKVSLDKCTVNGGTKEYSYGINEGNNIAKVCELSDEDGDGQYSIGDIITCEFAESTEQFYVIENENEDTTPETIDMLSKYNLNVGNHTYKDGKKVIQNGNAEGSSVVDVEFSSIGYWKSNVSSYPAYVYNENSNLYQYVTEYEEYLKENGVVSASATLISGEQLENLGCSYTGCNNINISWLISPTSWTGVAIDPDLVSSIGGGGEEYYKPYRGVRPVVTIAKSQVNLIYEEINTEPYKPQYYYFSFGWSEGKIGDDLPSSAKKNVLDIDTQGYPMYLGLDVDNNNKISATYVCFIKDEKEHCLKGGTKINYKNKITLEEAFKNTNDSCSFGYGISSCYEMEGSLSVSVEYNGDIRVVLDKPECYVRSNYFRCSEG